VVPVFEEFQILPNFVVIEGIDGAGTTTQNQLLDQALSQASIPHSITAEPTTGPIGKLIRSVLNSNYALDPGTTAHLFAADRWEHIYGAKGIKNQCDNGDWVISDRYLFSSLAYQGLLTDSHLVWELNKKFPLPEYLIFIDTPEEVGSHRRSLRTEREIYEQDEFQAQVAQRYRSIFHELSRCYTNLLILQGDENPLELHKRILDFLPILSRK
jgi:dTMP kinase